MFVAMNRFKVVKGSEEAFEAVWKARDTKLNEMKGFVDFHLLRGPDHEDHTLYASHTIWATREDFEDWTKSEAFRMAHAGAGKSEGIMMGRPNLEVFESVQELT